MAEKFNYGGQLELLKKINSLDNPITFEGASNYTVNGPVTSYLSQIMWRIRLSSSTESFAMRFRLSRPLRNVKLTIWVSNDTTGITTMDVKAWNYAVGAPTLIWNVITGTGLSFHVVGAASNFYPIVIEFGNLSEELLGISLYNCSRNATKLHSWSWTYDD